MHMTEPKQEGRIETEKGSPKIPGRHFLTRGSGVCTRKGDREGGAQWKGREEEKEREEKEMKESQGREQREEERTGKRQGEGGAEHNSKSTGETMEKTERR